jgi:cohesin domain-containing protein
LKAFVIISMLILSMAGTTFAFNSVAGDQVGVVCIAQLDTVGCPSTPPTFSGNPGANLTVLVNIQNSNTTNGFDISIMTDPTILNPVAINYAGTVEPQPLFLVLECINGQLVVGSRCLPTDVPGVARLALVSLGTSTTPPTTGTLFAITFQILRAQATNIGYQTGCTSSSVAGTTTCVSITDGTSNPVPVTIIDPEFVQTAMFSNIPVNATIHYHGLTIVLNGTVTIDTVAKIVTGKVTLRATNDTTGMLIFSKTFSFTFVYIASQNIMFGLAIGATSPGLAAVCGYNQSANTFTCSTYRNPDMRNRGVVDILDAATLAIAYGSSPGSPNWNPAADLDGTGVVDILDASTLAVDYSMPVYA